MNNSKPEVSHVSKKDLAEIRGTTPGRLLSLSAAFLSLVWIFADKAFRLSKLFSTEFGLPAWLTESITFVGAPSVVAIYLLNRWLSTRNLRAIKLLAVTPAKAKPSYFTIGPYTGAVEDQERFVRADNMHLRVKDWIAKSGSSVLFLLGDSGTGKSSLLSAAALPSLKKDNWKIVEVRAWQDPFAQMERSLLSLRRPRAHGATAGLKQLLADAKGRNAKLLVLIDQFEEFIILGEEEKVAAFASWIRDLAASPIPGVILLLSMRSDYQAKLDEWDFPPLRQGENWLQIGSFTLAAATDFLKKSGLGLQPESVDRLIASAALMDASPGIVRPITLNVIGYVLSQGTTQATSLDAGELVRGYVKQAVEGDATRTISRTVLERLVTEQGTKLPVSESELIAVTKLRRGEVRAVLNSLSAAALARPLDLTQGIWELTHDFVARAVIRYLGRPEKTLWRNVAAFCGA